MKVLLILGLIAGGFALPATDIKYRWNPVRDQDGRVHIFDRNPVELEQEPEPAFNAMTDVVFILFTRRNPTAGQIINFNMNSVRNSQFAAAQGVRFIIHGWNSNRNTAMNNFMRNDFLALANHNVIVVDWGAGAQTPNYLTARNRVGDVGAAVARMMDELVGAGLSAFSRINVVGHSLGGHVAGFSGKRATRGRIQALFATDPAGPLFSLNDPANRLAAGDAVYTEAIHTNAGVLGFDAPITHAAFYPNWGTTQPGCGTDATGACAHERSNLFYSESINSARFVARRCAAGYSAITSRNCPTGGGTGTMGRDSSKSLNGVFFLETNAAAPFARG
jgi:pimeloyl-ACP methyl ester carboxylesterase